MKYWTWCVGLGLLFVPCLAVSQQHPKPAQSENLSTTFTDVTWVAQENREPQKIVELRRYEEIEIMRRILEQTIRRVATLPRGDMLLSDFHKAGEGRGAAIVDFDGDGDLDIFIARGQNPQHAAAEPWRNLFNSGDDSIWKAHAGVAPFEAVEGFYLKGCGIVYTAALAALFQEPVRRANEPAAKPLSDWERIRKELHGEKIEAGKREPPPKHDSVAASLLKALAENGHNFTHLPDNEQVTVALTLRRGQDCMLCHKGVALSGAGETGDVRNLFLFDHSQSMNQGGKTSLLRNNGDGTFTDVTPTPGANAFADSAAVRASQWLQGLSAGSKEASSERNAKPSRDIDLDGRIEKTDAQNQTLLGDLSMKQRRYKEAAAAYRKALDDHQKSVRSQAEGRTNLQGEVAAVELASKLAQAALAAGDPEGAIKALQEVTQYSNRLEQASKVWKEERRRGDKNQAPKAAPLPLPAKLIISAPKRLLDEVGAGKISFEEFKKAATVQYLNFSGTKPLSDAPDSK